MIKEQYTQGEINKQEYEERCELWGHVLNSYIK